MTARGYFGIGVYHPKTEHNIGTLWRSAHLFGAAFVFTVGRRYSRQATDTPKTARHTPLFHYPDVDDLREHLPHASPLVGVELAAGARALPGYVHPERAVYLLGAEDNGIPERVLDQCHAVISIPTTQPQSLNVAVAGSIIIYDRSTKSRES